MNTLTNSQQNFFLKAGPLLLVIFIDSMGLGLVFPVLNALITDPQTGFFTAAITPTLHNIIFGTTIGIFMLSWFVGAAILGDVSDQIGRKKSLLICLLGSFAGYFLSALAVVFHSLSLLIVGRVIAGFTSGSQPIAQAAIIDISTSEHKARNIGMIMLSASLGFVFGPLIGGFLSDNSFVSWFNFATPFYFAATISLLNAGLLLWIFNETFTHTKKINIKLNHAFNIFISAFKDRKVRKLSIIFFIFMLGWGSFYSFISMFLSKTHNFSPTKISVFMAAMGIGFGIGNYFVDYLTKRYPLKANVVVGLLLAGLFIVPILMFNNSIFAWLCVIPMAASAAIGYSALITIFSNQVDADSQGWIMGITGSIMAFVFGIDAFIGGALASLDIKLPITLAAIALLLAGLLMRKMYNPKPTTDSAVTMENESAV